MIKVRGGEGREGGKEGREGVYVGE